MRDADFDFIEITFEDPQSHYSLACEAFRSHGVSPEWVDQCIRRYWQPCEYQVRSDDFTENFSCTAKTALLFFALRQQPPRSRLGIDILDQAALLTQPLSILDALQEPQFVVLNFNNQ